MGYKGLVREWIAGYGAVGKTKSLKNFPNQPIALVFINTFRQLQPQVWLVDGVVLLVEAEYFGVLELQ